MIKVVVAITSTKKAPVLRDENTYTPADAIKEAGFADQGGTWFLNSASLRAEQMHMTFGALGYGTATGRTSANLTNIIKADNA